MAVIYAGMRFAEEARMTWETTARQEDFWETVVRGKSGKLDHIRVHKDETVEKLDPYAALDEIYRRAKLRAGGKEPTGSILVSVTGAPLSRRAVRYAAKMEMKRAGIENARPYRLRAATVTALHGENVTDAAVARFVRHSQRSAVQHTHYQHNDRGKSCAKKITEIFVKKGGQ
jgi:integrase